MARLLVGLPAFQGELKKYSGRFDMVEVRPIDTSVPRAATLRKWRASVSPSFVFSVVLPRVVGELAPGAALEEALAASLEVASALEAHCVVLQTPASVRPTAANKKRIAALLARVPTEGTVRCWEAGGLWERDEIIETARAMDVVPVLDAAREQLAPGPIAYTRLRALGKSSQLGASAMERVADRLRKRREAFVIVEGTAGAGQRMRSALIAEIAKKPGRASSSSIVRPAIPTLIAEDEEQ